jgi:hypothetical protein
MVCSPITKLVILSEAKNLLSLTEAMNHNLEQRDSCNTPDKKHRNE